ncbi:MAG: hypothetical protein KAV83_10325 [Desulfobacterales bacterium]|nr:hypothetical protein [Desulfobacterales bacterium]
MLAKTENEECPIWERTIFAKFDNQELKAELEKWANDNRCEIYWGSYEPDIVGIPYFVSIIDRNVLGLEAWELYLAFQKNDFTLTVLGEEIEVKSDDQEEGEPNDNSVCIIVDGIRNIELPNNEIILCIDLKGEHSIPWIIKSVDFAKKRLKRNLTHCLI